MCFLRSAFCCFLQTNWGQSHRSRGCEDYRGPWKNGDAGRHRRAHPVPNARQGHGGSRRLLPGHPRRSGWGHNYDQYARLADIQIWHYRCCRAHAGNNPVCLYTLQSTMLCPSLARAWSLLSSSGESGRIASPAVTIPCMWTSLSGTVAPRKRWKLLWRIMVCRVAAKIKFIS